MGARWSFNLIYFDDEMTPKQRIFAHMVIKELREEFDPRAYGSARGFVEALGDFRNVGGVNLSGYYKFKPTNQLRKVGLDIRIIFQVLINDGPIYPQQKRLPRPNPQYCCIKVLYVGTRDSNTYSKETHKKLKMESRKRDKLRVMPDVVKPDTSNN